MCECVCSCPHPDTNRWQVAHHEEGCKGGVKEEGDPLGGCSWDAQAANTGCVCWRNTEKKTHNKRITVQLLIVVTAQLHGFVIPKLGILTCDFLKWSAFTPKLYLLLKLTSYSYTFITYINICNINMHMWLIDNHFVNNGFVSLSNTIIPANMNNNITPK